MTHNSLTLVSRPDKSPELFSTSGQPKDSAILSKQQDQRQRELSTERSRCRDHDAIFEDLGMRARPLYVKLFVAIVTLLTTVPWVYAQDGLQGALSRANVVSPVNLATPFRQTLAAADFDADHKPDGAVLLDDGWLQSHGVLHKIEIHLSGHRNTELTFESNEAELAISALDVNHDGAPDIVVERPLSRKRLYVWLNDGRGGFHEAAAQDFPSAVDVSGRQIESPAGRQGCLAAGLPPQRGFDGTAFGARALSFRDSSTNDEAQVHQSAAASRVTAANSSRAPPLPESL